MQNIRDKVVFLLKSGEMGARSIRWGNRRDHEWIAPDICCVNAAIEAARAGEHGKGSPWADGSPKLAERSSVSTTEIGAA
jgi:hypothetical protein